jgi:hypothetical protein
MSTPEMRMDPLVDAVTELLSLIIEDAVTDFPEPLSPTIPKVSPLRRSKDTSLTAATSPSGVWKTTDKFLTESTTSFDIVI